MSSVREAWTDERLDDLSDRMDRGFARVDHDLRDLREEVREQGRDLRGEIGSLGVELRAEIGSLGGELRTEMGDLGGEVRAEIGSQGRELRGEIGELRSEMNARFDAMYRTMVYGGCGIIGTVVASIAATLLT